MERYWAWEYGAGDQKKAIELVRAADAQATVEALQRERDDLQVQLRLSRFNQENAEAEYNGLQAQIRTLTQQLDAERAKVKRLSTCGTDHSTPWWQVRCEDLEEQLSQLQALVRALPNLEHFDVGVDDHGGEIRLPDGYILFTATSRNRTYVLEQLLKYRATLDATTPALTIKEARHIALDVLYNAEQERIEASKGGDGE